MVGGLLTGGSGALSDGKVGPEELRNIAIQQMGLGNTAGVNAVVGYINATTPNSKSELALAAAGGDKSAQEALRIITGVAEVKPLSQIAKLNTDLRNGLITQEQFNRTADAVGRSPNFKETYMVPILNKIVRGDALTDGENQIKEFFKTTDPWAEMIKAATQQPTAASPGASNEAQLLQQARDALAQGKDPAAVDQILRDRGINPAKLLSQGTINR